MRAPVVPSRLTSADSKSEQDSPNTAARVTRSWAKEVDVIRPAMQAASSRAASRDQSSRGQPPGSRESGSTPDPARRRAARVEHDEHSAVTLGAPRSDDDVGAARGCPPVDGAHVVAHDIFAK